MNAVESKETLPSMGSTSVVVWIYLCLPLCLCSLLSFAPVSLWQADEQLFSTVLTASKADVFWLPFCSFTCNLFRKKVMLLFVSLVACNSCVMEFDRNWEDGRSHHWVTAFPKLHWGMGVIRCKRFDHPCICAISDLCTRLSICPFVYPSHSWWECGQSWSDNAFLCCALAFITQIVPRGCN